MTSTGLLTAAWTEWPWAVAALLCSGFALLVAWLMHVSLLARSDGDEPQRAATAERFARALVALASGAKAIAAFALIVLVLLLTAADSTAERFTAWSFVLGAALALLIGWITLRAEHAASGRALEAARSSTAAGIRIATSGGLIAGLAAAGLLLAGFCTLWFLCRDPQALLGLAFGVGVVALVSLVAPQGGGGRAAALAPVVRSADLVASFASALCAAMLLGASVVREAGHDAAQRPGLLVLPLSLAGAGVVASFAARRPLRAGAPGIAAFVGAAVWLILALLLSAFADREPLAATTTGDSFAGFALALAAGPIGGLAIARMAGYARSSRWRGAAALPALLIAGVLVVANQGAGRYGVALAALALVAPLGLRVAVRHGADEVSGSGGAGGGDGADQERLAGARGLSTAAAALASLALLRCYCEAALLPALDLLDVNALAGLLFGVLLPFLFLSSARPPPIAPDAEGGRATSTKGSLRAMIAPAFVALVVPLVVGRLNPVALGGLLAGAIVCGVLLALRFARSGAVLLVLIELMTIVAVIAARR